MENDKVICDQRGAVLRVMPIDVIIEKVSTACKKCGVERLELFGSFATKTATPRSDIDFVVYGNVDSELLDKMINDIETLRIRAFISVTCIRDESPFPLL